MSKDLFQAPDYYLMDELLSEEHKLLREATRDWVKREVSPIIEDYAQRAAFPQHLVKGLADIGAFGPYIPQEYGGLAFSSLAVSKVLAKICSSLF